MGRHVPGHRRLRALAAAGALPLLALLTATPAVAQDSAEAGQLFTQRCASCHTIGDGNKVGPDLLGVTDRRDEAWLTRFLKSPGALIDDNDPVASELVKKFNGVRMPDQELTDAERQSLFAFFRECSKKGGCKAAAGPKFATDATPEEIEHGRQLFVGEAALANGGPSCVGCHNVRGIGVVGGGTLAKDLTFAYARLGERGLKPGLASMPSPLMKRLYGKAPLTESEQYELRAYLADVSRDGTPPHKDRDFFYLGFVGLFVALGFIGIVVGDRGGK